MKGIAAAAASQLLPCCTDPADSASRDTLVGGPADLTGVEVSLDDISDAPVYALVPFSGTAKALSSDGGTRSPSNSVVQLDGTELTAFGAVQHFSGSIPSDKNTPGNHALTALATADSFTSTSSAVTYWAKRLTLSGRLYDSETGIPAPGTIQLLDQDGHTIPYRGGMDPNDQGRFAVEAKGPADLYSVRFRITRHGAIDGYWRTLQFTPQDLANSPSVNVRAIPFGGLQAGVTPEDFVIYMNEAFQGQIRKWHPFRFKGFYVTRTNPEQTGGSFNGSFTREEQVRMAELIWVYARDFLGGYVADIVLGQDDPDGRPMPFEAEQYITVYQDDTIARPASTTILDSGRTGAGFFDKASIRIK